MRIAAISDIHGDYRSLQFVWQDLTARGLAERIVLNAGDNIAYGCDTMPCINFVRDPKRRIVSVGGNYDYNAAKFPKKQEAYRRKWGRLRPEKFKALKDASTDLTGDAREWLRDLPSVKNIPIEGETISLSHYAPTSEKEGLYADTTEARLRQISTEIGDGISIVVIGHTHTPFVRRSGQILFVNPGSIGRSHGSPTYAEIDITPGELPTARIISCRVLQR